MVAASGPPERGHTMEYMGIEITEHRIIIRRDGKEQTMTFPPTNFGKVAYEAAAYALSHETSAYHYTEGINVGTGVMEYVFI